jgi:hypothetical protein
MIYITHVDFAYFAFEVLECQIFYHFSKGLTQ